MTLRKRLSRSSKRVVRSGRSRRREGSGRYALRQAFRQIEPGVAEILPRGYVFRRAFRDQEAAVLAALRSEVDDPVG